MEIVKPHLVNHKPVVWAFDDGYGDSKCFNGSNTFHIPSFYTEYRPKPQQDFENDDFHPFDYISAEIDGIKYVIGKGASELDANISWLGGENKHVDLGFPILLKSCLGLMGFSEFHTVDKLVMGLPIKAEEDPQRHELLQKLVVGKHEVILTLANGKEMKRNITIKDLIIKKQPFGSFCDVILNHKGELIKKDVASEFNVVVDIGARTLNVYTLDSLKPVPDLCKTTNHGMFEAYTMVGRYIENKLQYPVPSGKLPSIIEKGMINRVNLSNAIQKSYEIHANEIKKVIDTMFVNSWAYVSRLIFTGGGSEIMKEQLQRLYQDKETVFLGRYNTVRGLQKYGLRQLANEQAQQARKVIV